jgi:hypothetical protein
LLERDVDIDMRRCSRWAGSTAGTRRADLAPSGAAEHAAPILPLAGELDLGRSAEDCGRLSRGRSKRVEHSLRDAEVRRSGPRGRPSTIRSGPTCWRGSRRRTRTGSLRW